MIGEVLFIAPFLVFALGLIWLIRRIVVVQVPEPDGLYAGERLIESAYCMLILDDVGDGTAGFAYLTDMRLIWTPRLVLFGAAPLYGVLQAPGDVTFPEMWRVTVGSWLRRNELRLLTDDHSFRLQLRRSPPRRWARYIEEHARNLVPAGEPFQPDPRPHLIEVMRKRSRAWTVFWGAYLGVQL